MHPILLIMWTAFQSFKLRDNNNNNNNNNFKTYKAQISISIYLNVPNPCYDQLTAVKKSIRWSVSHDCIRFKIHWADVFFKVIRWPSFGFHMWSRTQVHFLNNGIYFAFCLREKSNYLRKTFLTAVSDITRPSMSKTALDFGFFCDVNQKLKNRCFLTLTS